MSAGRIGLGLGRQICLLFLGVLLLLSGECSAQAPIKIVAFGTSNTLGRYVARGSDYPAKLEAALRAKGHNVQVTNAGRNGDMIAGALARLDSAVPVDTQIAIVEFGVNDRREHNSQAYIQAGLDKIVANAMSKSWSRTIWMCRAARSRVAPTSLILMSHECPWR
jgi:acyl-CoA thioesterase I